MNKSRSSGVSLLHALLYGLPFLTQTRSLTALAIIAGSHFVIDRWRLTRYLIWAKNWLSPRPYLPLSACDAATGFPNERPAWMRFWLFVVVDNLVHVVINAWALTTFGGRAAAR